MTLAALPLVAGLAAAAQAQTLSVGAPADVEEGDSGTHDLIFPVTLSQSVAAPVDFKVCFSGTATLDSGQRSRWADGADYRLIFFDLDTSCYSASLFPGETSASPPFGIQVRGETDIEPDETVKATLSFRGAPPAGVTLGTATATVTIKDDDTPPAANLFIDDGKNHDRPEGARPWYSFILARAPESSERFRYPLTLGGTAVRGTDYTLSCRTDLPGVTCTGLDSADPAVVIDGSLAGRRSISLLYLDLTEDSTTESRETVTLRLNDRTVTLGIVDAPSSVAVSLTTATATTYEFWNHVELAYTVTPPTGSAIVLPLVVTGVTATA
ncbi:MAG: hypothetical protein F4226_08310, partial [Synechococcus sp. SB0678_bin_12]|nr:hypothetical protein [Synechococcus sp. SB0678_bin_12]